MRYLPFLAVLLAVGLWLPVGAQQVTPTPTASPTNTPGFTATPTKTPPPVPNLPTPNPTPDGGGANTVWFCLYTVGGYTRCTWGDSFFSYVFVQDEIGYPSSEISDKYILVIPPPNTQTLELDCTYTTQGDRPSGAQHVLQATIGETSAYLTSLPARHLITRSNDDVRELGFYTYYGNIDLGADKNWTLWTTKPAEGLGTLTPSNFAHIRVYLSAGCVSCNEANPVTWINTGFGCVVHSLKDKQNVVRQPNQHPVTWPTATPVPVLPTATVCYIGCGELGGGNPWATPPPWSVTPQPGEFGTTPGATTCNTIIPSFNWGPYSVFGYELGFGWAATTICATENAFAWQLFGIDFGAWAGGLLLVSAVSMIYSRLK
jgi:hypothetical protein